jgi:DNA-binding SARP family transcriptional activator/DNA-binding beta-propeller fold protein YncE
MEFRILGPLEVVDNETPVALFGHKQRMLLSLFLLQPNRVISADRMIEDLWEGRPPDSAAKALQVHVSQLRKALGAGRIETRGRGYLFRLDRDELDATRLEQALDRARSVDSNVAANELARVLELWRGDPFDELSDHEAARTEIARLHELRLATIERRIEAELAIGAHVAVTPELEALVRAHPFREPLRVLLMLALYRGGRQAEALDVARDGRRLLDQELGLEPGEALRGLERQILAHDPALDLEPGPSAAVGAPTLPTRQGWAARRPWLLAAAGVTLLAAVVAAVVLSSRGGNGRLVTVGADALGQIDSSTGRIIASVPIAGGPGPVASSGRWIWVAGLTSQTVDQISARSRAIEHVISLTKYQADDVAADAGGAWVLDAGRRTVVRIDGSYGQVSRTLTLPQSGPEAGGASIDAGLGALWVTDGSTRLLKLDPQDGHKFASFDLGSYVDDVAVGSGLVWASSRFSSAVFSVNPATGAHTRIPIVGRPTDTTPLPIAITAGLGSVWVLTGNTPSVVRIDPRLESVTATIPLAVGDNASAISAGEGAVWVAETGSGTVARIDPSTNRVTSIEVGGAPANLATGDSSAWVAVRAGASSESVRAPTVTVPGSLPTAFCGAVEYGGSGRPKLLIASDFPLQGSGYSALSVQMNDAIRFELAQRGYRAGPYSVGFQPCDESSAAFGEWTQPTCVRNATAYAHTAKLVGIVGPFSSGCALYEVPIMNRAAGGPVAMISGSTTNIELTHRAVPPGRPDSLYPTGARNFARVIAPDDVQVAADMVLAQRLGVHRLYLLYDNGYEANMPRVARSAAKLLGIDVAGSAEWVHDDLTDERRIARRVAQTSPDGVFLIGALDPQLVRDLRARLGADAALITPDGFSDMETLVQQAGPAAEGVTVSFPTASIEALSSSGQRFAGAFRSAIHQSVEPFSVTAAQSADVLLDAIARSDGTRASVTANLLHARVSDGILGSFEIGPSGDPRPGQVTIFRIRDGKPYTYAVITPPARLVRLGSG